VPEIAKVQTELFSLISAPIRSKREPQSMYNENEQIIDELRVVMIRHVVLEEILALPSDERLKLIEIIANSLEEAPKTPI